MLRPTPPRSAPRRPALTVADPGRGRAAAKDAARAALRADHDELAATRSSALLERMLPTEALSLPARCTSAEASSQDLYDRRSDSACRLDVAAASLDGMDVVAVLLALVAFALLFALITGIDRI